MSRATLAVDMWFRIGPPHSAQARSAWIQTRSSWRVTGNGNGARAATASSVVSKHCRGVLRATPRGSKLTRSNRARTCGEYSSRPIACRKSTPEPPGPPGLKKIEPMRAPGPDAGKAGQGEADLGPRGLSWSSGTLTVAHTNPCPSSPQLAQATSGTAAPPPEASRAATGAPSSEATRHAASSYVNRRAVIAPAPNRSRSMRSG